MKKTKLALLLAFCGVTAANGQDYPILRIDPQGHSARVWGLAFTPDGTELVTASQDKTIRVRDVATGAERRVIRGWLSDGEQGQLFALAIDPAGRYLACGGWFPGRPYRGGDPVFAIRIIDFRTGRMVRVLEMHLNTIASLRFSPDGEFLASSDTNGSINLWRTRDWNTTPTSMGGHKDRVLGLAFSPDGSRLASAGFSGSIQIAAAVYSTDIFQDPTVLLRADEAHKGGISHIAWSPDGKTIATGGESDGEVKLWNAEDLSPRGVLKKVSVGNLSRVAFLDDSTLLCGGTYGVEREGTLLHPLYLIDIDTKAERVYWGHSDTIIDIEVAPDGRTVASSGGDNHEVLLWDSRSLATLHTITGKGKTVWATAFDRGAASILYGTEFVGETHRAETPLRKRFNLENGTISDWVGEAPGGGRVILERNGERLGFSGTVEDRTLKVGQRSRTLPDEFDTINTYTYTPDGKYIIVGTDFALYRLNAETLRIAGTLVGHEGPVTSVSVSEDGKTLISGGSDQTIRLWDIDTSEGHTPYLDPRESPVYTVDPYGLTLPEDDPNADREEMFRRWKEVRDPASPKSSEFPHAKPLLSLFIGTDDEWIAWTPQGYYDCSLNGAKYAGWHFNRGEGRISEFYSLEQYASVFYRPDVIEKALRREHPELPSVSFEDRPPRIVEFRINGEPVRDDGEIVVETDRSEFSLELASAGTAPLRQPELFYNGRVINQGKFKGPPQVKLAADKRSLTARYSFTVTNKDNRYKVYTVDERGFKSAAKTVRVVYTGADAAPAFFKLGEKVAPPKRSGTLHVLAVGINRYVNPAMAAAGMDNLSYAEKDAADMASLWATQEGRLFEKVESRVLTRDSLGRDVNAEDVLNALTVLSKKATQDTDSILIFLSGHGLRKDDGFFFLTAEADPTTKASLAETSPSWPAIGDKLKAMTRVKEIVVLVDACHSGAINPTELGFTWKDKGVVLITSSKAGQRSYEGGVYRDERDRKSVFENGLFTAAIVEGFTRSQATDVAASAPADLSRDDVLIVGEVLSYATERVGKWTEGQQTPWVPAYDPSIEGKVLGVVR